MEVLIEISEISDSVINIGVLYHAEGTTEGRLSLRNDVRSDT